MSMSLKVGTQDAPLRVAIIGSGPSGFYAAERFQKQSDLVVEIDMFDRLPTPYGLVRGGVAPDHAKIKSVTKVYDRIAAHPSFRFYGNVEFGRDVSRDELVQHYHQVIYAVGAQTDRRMDVPGEDLSGSHAATEFVGWYNAHPDYRDFSFDLTQERVAVIGNGNVAMDVARILASSYDELAKTDIADYALEALKDSKVREIYVLGRRGPAQAAFTNPEIKELNELAETQVVITQEDATLDPLSEEWLAQSNDRTAKGNVAILQQYAEQPPNPNKPRAIYMRFLESPIELIGSERVEAIKIVKNELYQREDGSLRPRPTDKTETFPVGLVFRSIGYLGVALPGVPFHERWGIIPNNEGRVTDPDKDDEPVLGEYVVGWIKRGPSGIIGTNKPDSHATVDHMLEDWRAGKLLSPSAPTRAELEQFLRDHNIDYVTFADWEIIDAIEQERGQASGQPRIKFSRVDAMLAALKERKRELESAGN